jgi:AbrB family looped-hinge helix DNA binding protein
MKVTTKGQVAIPVRIREYLGITPHSKVEFQIRAGNVVLVAKKTDHPPVESMAALRGTLKGRLTTRQWMRATRGQDAGNA